MTTMTKRLDALEKARPSAGPRRVIRLVVASDEGETTEEVIARWCAENPGEPPPAAEDLIILHSLVSPPGRPDASRPDDAQARADERLDHDH